MQPKSIFRIPLGLPIHSHGATEPLKVIAASNGVKKLGPKEGRTKQLVIRNLDTNLSKPSTVCSESRQKNRTRLQNNQNVFKAVLREKYLFYETRIYLS